MAKNSGYLVTTKKGKKGRTYHSKGLINGKVQVYLMTDNFKLTGERLLCEPSSLAINGFLD